MPRVAAPRPGAPPRSPRQQDRHRRILSAAARLASEQPLERVQMQEVARAADVALATLYRYFPSKMHLFVGVLLEAIERFGADLAAQPHPGEPPAAAATRVLVAAQRTLLARPRLAHAMLTSANTADASVVPDVALLEERFAGVLLAVTSPAAHDDAARERVRLLMELWFGVLTSVLLRRIDVALAESDLARGCQLLLA